MRRNEPSLALIALILAGAGAGCSMEGAGLDLAAIPAPKGADNSNSPPSPLASIAMPKGIVVGTPTEVYTRVARGVLTCWFGAAGPLKGGYIYHAEAEPASKGGASEIKIMTRDAEAEDPRALRAYRVVISPSQAGSTNVEVENTRLPEPLALSLKADVERWSADEPGCEGPVTAGWAAQPAAEKESKNKGKKKDD